MTDEERALAWLREFCYDSTDQADALAAEFAAVRAEEREACAKIVEDEPMPQAGTWEMEDDGAEFRRRVLTEIRARNVLDTDPPRC